MGEIFMIVTIGGEAERVIGGKRTAKGGEAEGGKRKSDRRET